MAANPEMGAVGKLGQGLSGLLGQAGGAGGLGQAGGSPSPFGLGNLLPGILQNPLGSLFGGGGSGGGAVVAPTSVELAREYHRAERPAAPEE